MVQGTWCEEARAEMGQTDQVSDRISKSDPLLALAEASVLFSNE